MTLLIIIEVILSVVFASGMMLYIGMHFLRNQLSNNSRDVSCNDENSTALNDTDIQSGTKNDRIIFSKECIISAFEIIKERKLIWFLFAVVAFSVGIWFYDILYLEFAMLKSYINSIMFILVATMGYIDYKEHIIPNPLVLTGIGIWVIAFIIEIFVGGTPWKETLSFSLMGFAVCGGILLILAIILRSGLGMGDVKMYAMLGLLYGLTNTYSLLICTVIPMAIVAIILLARKKVTKKSTLPMAPFTVFAFLVGILSGM